MEDWEDFLQKTFLHQWNRIEGSTDPEKKRFDNIYAIGKNDRRMICTNMDQPMGETMDAAVER